MLIINKVVCKPTNFTHSKWNHSIRIVNRKHNWSIAVCDTCNQGIKPVVQINCQTEDCAIRVFHTYTCWLLAEYQNVFSLDPVKLGCTHSMEHTIKMIDDTPFKEWFRQIPLPLLEEVQNHQQEMLESGAIQAQPECLVQCGGVGKEEGWQLTVLHQLLLPEHLHEKGLLPLPRIQEALESLVGAGHFSRLDLKLGFWQIKREEAS